MAGQIPEGNRFTDVLKFRRIGEGGGSVLYECWGEAVEAYVAQAVAAERERCARIVERINGWTCTREVAAEIRGETQVLRA